MNTLVIVGAVAGAVAGGVFFAFSTFVMGGLRRLPDREGLLAMQAVNRAAPTPAFMLLLFGTAAVDVVIGVLSVLGRGPAPLWQVIGTVLYLSVIALTAGFHVPRNTALDRVNAADPAAGAAWRSYARSWTAGNHIRTVASIGSAAALTFSLTGG